MGETLKSIESVAQSIKEYDRIIRGRETNADLAIYYETLAEFGSQDKKHIYLNKARNMRDCHKIMVFDYYKSQGVKDYQSTSFCHDRFCPNCQKLIANTREQKFKPLVEKIAQDYQLYALTLTMKNSIGDIAYYIPHNENYPKLVPTIKKMSKCFKKLVRYLTSDAKIKGLDFSYLGYAGAIRTLEITYKSTQEYHPHYHCILAMKKGLKFSGATENAYSTNSRNKEPYLFTDFEILIQKIWYLILNDIRVTKQAIDELKIGYSCMMTEVDKENTHQAFKYAIKPERDEYMSFAVFQDLVTAMHGMRQVQCYGCFFGLKLEDEEISEEFDPFYDPIIKALSSVERPIYASESPTNIRDNIQKKKYIYISRKSIRRFAEKWCLDEELSLMTDKDKAVKVQQLMMSEIMSQSKVVEYDCFDGGRNVKPKGGNNG